LCSRRLLTRASALRAARHKEDLKRAASELQLKQASRVRWSHCRFRIVAADTPARCATRARSRSCRAHLSS
jgi:hypothetical protein